MDLIQALRHIGLTQQESMIYMVLCKQGMMTGYEAAKLSGISRSNAYAALASLVDKGYAYMIEGSSSKYVPIPKDELISNARKALDETITTIEHQLVYNDTPSEPYMTIMGEKIILQKLINCVEIATLRIYLSCNKQVLLSLENALQRAAALGLKVVILSPEDVRLPFEHTYYPIPPSDSYKMIVDTKAVMAGTFEQSLYSKNATLVTLIRESFIHEIAVIQNQTSINGGSHDQSTQ